MAGRISVNFNVLTVSSRLKNHIKRTVQPVLDNEILKDSNKYAPMDTGNLISSGVRGTRLGSGLIVWDSVYARRQYFENNNKSKDSNPNATYLWFEVAKAQNKSKWVAIANRVGGFS